MKIGILTFHSQLNYGGVLQCWALQTILEELGHEVVVIDRWHDAANSMLERGYGKRGWRQWLNFLLRSVLGLGDLGLWLRVRRTKTFIKENLRLTPYHFVKWKEAPTDLGVDLLVVGSDQVWHCGDWGDPRPYLLIDAPSVPAIAYAASFGMVELPARMGCSVHGGEELSAVPLFKQGLQRFKAISCREREGVEICKRLGFDAIHVVDPTLLAWKKSAEDRVKRREVVCYFLSEKIEDHFVGLEEFAKRNSCKVRVLMDGAWLLAFPSSWTLAKNLLRRWRWSFSRHVEVMDGAGPKEFSQAFKSARWVISDSFHALMFSICNGCEARIIKPQTESRRKMFARIEEFAEHAKGPLIMDSVGDALSSFMRGARIEYDYAWVARRRRESQSWLQANLK